MAPWKESDQIKLFGNVEKKKCSQREQKRSELVGDATPLIFTLSLVQKVGAGAAGVWLKKKKKARCDMASDVEPINEELVSSVVHAGGNRPWNHRHIRRQLRFVLDSHTHAPPKKKKKVEGRANFYKMGWASGAKDYSTSLFITTKQLLIKLLLIIKSQLFLFHCIGSKTIQKVSQRWKFNSRCQNISH